MRCLYCDNEINKYSLSSLFLQEDKLCINCRNRLKIKKEYLNYDGLRVEVLYEYDDLFKSVLLQYKECCDEALSEVFLYMLNDYINIKYHGYKIVFIPSSESKLNKRGFNHLELIFKDVKLKRVDGLMMKEELIQENKSYEDRSKMINNYVYFGDNLDKVLIVDDVLTSGSSIKGAYKALKPYCKHIRALSLANVRKRFHFSK